MRMTLRQRTLLTIGVVFLVLILILSAAMQVFMMGNIDRQEESIVLDDVEEVLNGLDDHIASLNSTAGDWAAWDDTYAFIEDGNQEYISSNLVDGTFIELGINFMLFLNNSGQPVYMKAVDLDRGVAVPVPRNLVEALSSHLKESQRLKGVVLIPDGPVLIVARPILTSLDEGPCRGSLVMGRLLDVAALDRISHLTGTVLTVTTPTVTISTADTATTGTGVSSFPSSDLRTVDFSYPWGQASVLIRPLDEENIVGLVQIRDLNMTSSFLLRADISREMHRQGRSAMIYMIFSVVLTGLVFGSVILIILERRVLSPLETLSASVKNIKGMADLPRRLSVSGNDELSVLASAINDMLESLETSKRRLEQSEERVRDLLENTNDIICTIDLDWNITSINRVAEEITGYVRDELVGTNLSLYLVPESLQECKEAIVRQIASGEDKVIQEVGFYAKDKRRLDLEASVHIRYDGAEPYELLCVVRDTTERRVMEDALRESKELLEKVFTSLQEAVFILDGESYQIVGCNRAATDMFGYSSEEMVGKTTAFLHFNEASYSHFRDLELSLKEDMGFFILPDFSMRRKDGSVFPTEHSVTPLVGLEGALMGWVSVVRDVTEKVKAEDELRRRDRLLTAVASAANVLLVERDLKQAVGQALDLLGAAAEVDRVCIYESSDLCKRPVMSLIYEWAGQEVEPTGDDPAIYNVPYDQNSSWHKTLSSGDVVIWPAGDKRPAKDHPADLRTLMEPLGVASILAVPLILDDRLWGLIAFDDCRGDRRWDGGDVHILKAASASLGGAIARRRAEEALRKSRDEMEDRVQERTAELEAKNAEMERFIYTVSHDLRSPLVTVNGFVGFLKKDLSRGDGDRAEKDLLLIEGAVDKMDRLLEDTLELSRIGRVTSPPKNVPYAEIVQEALTQISDRLAGISVILADNMPVVCVDRMRMVEVMVNLLENSAKYMGGREHPRIEVGYGVFDGDIVFFVKDNGIGISPDQHEKVFGLFYKVEKDSEGTGAGLAIVKRIIEVHGGRIWIESSLGKGCTVCFTLPLAGP